MTIEITLYDQSGRPIAYSDDHAHLYYFDGTPVAYLNGEHVYSFSGDHLGYYINGWVFDHDGGRILFSAEAAGGPLRPLKLMTPLKGIKSVLPVKGIRTIPPVKPIPSLGWSDVNAEVFFEQE